MNHAYIVGTFDVAELAFLLFFGFFIALVFYLNRESRREGYPLEDEQTGKIHPGSLFDGDKKAFQLPHEPRHLCSRERGARRYQRPRRTELPFAARPGCRPATR